LTQLGPGHNGINENLYDIITDVPTSPCYYSSVYTCINFENLMDGKFKASEQLRKGMRVSCYTDKEKEGDLVQIEVKSTPGS